VQAAIAEVRPGIAEVKSETRRTLAIWSQFR